MSNQITSLRKIPAAAILPRLIAAGVLSIGGSTVSVSAAPPPPPAATASGPSAPAPAATPALTASAAPASPLDCSAFAPQARVDINTATEATLTTLPGMSVADAKKIIAQRPYSEVRDLQNLNVVSQKTYERVRGCLKVAGSSP